MTAPAPARRGRPNTVLCPPEHAHGAPTTCYATHRCNCFACRVGNAARTRRYAAKAAAGIRELVDPTPARDHIALLRRHGMTIRVIAARAGVPRSVMSALLYGRVNRTAERIHRDTEARILAVRPERPVAPAPAVTDGARISSIGARRRLEALQAIGWSLAVVAARMGVHRQAVDRLVRSHSILAATHRRLDAVYHDLHLQTPPTVTPQQKQSVSRTLRTAARFGYLPPLAWDDIDHDEQPATGDHDDTAVDDVAVDLALAGTPLPLRGADLTAYVARAHAAGVSRNDMIRTTGSERGVVAALAGLREERATA